MRHLAGAHMWAPDGPHMCGPNYWPKGFGAARVTGRSSAGCLERIHRWIFTSSSDAASPASSIQNMQPVAMAVRPNTITCGMVAKGLARPLRLALPESRDIQSSSRASQGSA